MLIGEKDLRGNLEKNVGRHIRLFLTEYVEAVLIVACGSEDQES
jgi:hypothetical protein